MMKRPVTSINLQKVGINTLGSPNALDTIERIMEYCRASGFINGDVTDIEALINDNEELDLAFKDLGHLDASIERIDKTKFKITINSRHPKRRQRFSMAHEYAHYQLHRDHLDKLAAGEQIMHRSAERDPREYQANRLAGEILMPAELFTRCAGELNYSSSLIADQFDVSLQAARMRAKELGNVLND